MPNVKDNFDWEAETLEKLRTWVKDKSNRAPDDAFKRFDKDFDGFVSKEDLRTGLINNLNVPAYQITDTRLDRLYRLLDTFKTGRLL